MAGLYSTARWQAYRMRQLADEPLCRFCLDTGRVTTASIADHVVPHRGDEAAFWSGKLQSLCKRCHDSIKQSIEKGGTSRIAIGRDGWPVG